jgi:hypothetical protein
MSRSPRNGRQLNLKPPSRLRCGSEGFREQEENYRIGLLHLSTKGLTEGKTKLPESIRPVGCVQSQKRLLWPVLA